MKEPKFLVKNKDGLFILFGIAASLAIGLWSVSWHSRIEKEVVVNQSEDSKLREQVITYPGLTVTPDGEGGYIVTSDGPIDPEHDIDITYR